MTSIFSKIIAGEIPSYKIYEDSKTLAFLDIDPNVEGHTLVICKQEFKNIFDAPTEALSELIKTVQIVSKMMQSNLGCDGVNITANNGEYAGQVVPHMHFHVIPRYKDDGIYAHKGLQENKESRVKKSLKEVQKILTNA